MYVSLETAVITQVYTYCIRAIISQCKRHYKGTRSSGGYFETEFALGLSLGSSAVPRLLHESKETLSLLLQLLTSHETHGHLMCTYADLPFM